MAFTYNSTLIGTSDISTIRFLLGDTSSGQNSGLGVGNLLTDGEISGATALFANNFLAAAMCCDVIAGRHAAQADVTNEGLSVQASQRGVQYHRLAAQLRRMAFTSAGIYAGGRSISEKQDKEDTSDAVQPSFGIGMDDYYPPTASTST